MKRLLLAVCAFGLLSLPAIAEEKSPEQRREESTQILNREGLQKFDVTRFVASGKSQRIGFFYSVHPDCTAQGDVDVRVTKQQEHGKTEIAAAKHYQNFEKENIIFICN